jgi:predicted O-linked N-acetylglucosamine transferase (SPINDLY family)
MHYVIADRTIIPPASVSSYAEKIVWMPDTYWVSDRKLAIGSKIPSRAEVGLPEKAFVYCCFNQVYKILPEVFDCWMRVLRQVDGSTLWLLGENAAAVDNLRKEAASRNVDPSRLVFAPRVVPADHLARHKCADLFLDTLPYNAHTTASDALWSGLPLVTQTGQAFAGRVATSQLTAIGLSELVTSTQDAYEALAVELATSPGKLRAIKDKLDRNRLAMPLFDTQRYTRHIETAYAEMYRRHRAGLPPEHIHLGQ